MRKLFLSATALVVLFAACSKDDENNNPIDPENGQTPKLHQSTVSALDSLASIYDANYKLVKQVRFDEKGVYRGTDSVVYENGKITKVLRIDKTGVATLESTLAYNSAGKLEKVSWYFDTGNTFSSYDSIVYNADGRPAATYNKGKDAMLRSKKVYTWDSKNLTREIRLNYSNGSTELKDTGIIDYTYDDKVNFGAKQAEIFPLESDEVGFAFSVNNVIQSVSRNAAYPDGRSVYTAEYTYDKDGYAATRKDHYKSYTGDQVTWSQEDAWWFHFTR